MKTFTLLLFVSISLISCYSKRKKMEFVITSGTAKYWYRYYKDTLKPYASGYCFSNNGTYLQYCNPNYNRKIRAICFDPSLPKQNWNINNDSIMMLGQNVYYKILFINEDSLVLGGINSRTSEFIKLHKELDQLTKPKNIVYWDTTASPGM